MRIRWVLLMVLSLTLTSCGPRYSFNSEFSKLAWSDEFDGGTVDASKWYAMKGTGPEENYAEYWGNNEKQYYREENAAVRDGQLVITVKREDYGGMAYTSARLTTNNLFSFTYGRAEARMKLPKGMEGVWPAFWMLPNGAPGDWAYGGWAASGEVDIMEYRSRNAAEVSAAAHFGAEWPANIYETGTYPFPEGTDASDWHVYGVEWRADVLIWFVDGEEYFRLDDWFSMINDMKYGKPKPFDQPFALLLNAAVGGNFDGNRQPDESFASAEVLVDWVRVYQ